LQQMRLCIPIMPARRLPPPWSVEELNACFIVTNRDEVLREANLMIKPLCHVLFAGALCLVGIDNINSANAQQTDQQTIVPKAEVALAAKIKCRDFRKNANGTWTSRPNAKIGANAFPAHTFDISWGEHRRGRPGHRP
jgi:hypothetical protein